MSLLFKRIQIIQSIFSDRSGIKLEISNRKVSGKSPGIWKLNSSWIQEKIKGEIRKYFVLNENTTYQNLWDATKAIF